MTNGGKQMFPGGIRWYKCWRTMKIDYHPKFDFVDILLHLYLAENSLNS